MNSRSSLGSTCRGFTLVELLVVIAIIAGLAGIAWTSISYMNRMAYRKKAEAQIQALQTGLQEYKIDQGSFPNSNSTTYASGPISGAALYQALSGNGNNLIGGSEASKEELNSGADLSGKSYLPELLPGNSSQQDWVLTVEDKLTVVDPWGQAWRYVSGDPSEQHNVDFDLWSIGPDGGDGSRDEKSDDIVSWR